MQAEKLIENQIDARILYKNVPYVNRIRLLIQL